MRNRRPRLRRRAQNFGLVPVADCVDRGGVEPRFDRLRRVREPLKSGFPMRAGDEDRKLGKSLWQARVIAAESTKLLRARRQLRAVQPDLQRPLHLAARAGDDRVVHFTLLRREMVGRQLGNSKHRRPHDSSWNPCTAWPRPTPAGCSFFRYQENLRAIYQHGPDAYCFMSWIKKLERMQIQASFNMN